MSKRIVTLFLTLIFMALQIPFTQIIVCADNSSDNLDLPNDITILDILGIMKTDKDMDKIVSRAELAEFLVKTSGVEMDAVQCDTVFLDVKKDSFYSGYIDKAYNFHYMSGIDKNYFFPEDNVSTVVAAAGLIRILGYDTYALNKGGWPSGYLQEAARLKIVSGIDFSKENITKKELALMIYRSLDISMLQVKSINEDSTRYTDENKKTLLYDRFNFLIIKGLVNEVRYTGLNSAEGCGKGHIRIGAQIYNVDESIDIQMPGRVVKAYTKEKDGELGSIIALYDDSKNNNRLQIKSGDIIDYDKSCVNYADEQGNIHRVNIYDGASIIYNGKYIGKYGTSSVVNYDLMPKEGKLTLIDNNSDDVYDVLWVEKYELIVIENIENNENGIKIYSKYDLNSDNQNDSINIVSDQTDYKFCDVNGNAVSIKNIKNKNVLTAVVSSDKLVVRAYVGNNKLMGKISEFDKVNNTLYVNDEMFNISNLMPENIINMLYIGSVQTFLMTADNEIAAIEKNVDLTEGSLGYMVKFADNKGLGNKFVFRIFTGLGEMKDFKTGSKFNVNGVKPSNISDLEKNLTSYTSSGAVRMNNVGASAYDQLVRYVLNDSNELISIITSKTGKNITKGSFSHDFDVDNLNKIYYYAATTVFNYTYKVSSDCLIFNVPADITKVDEFSIGNTFITDNFYKSLEFYNLDEFFNIGAIVYRADLPLITVDYRLAGKREASGGSYAIMVVDDISEGISSDGTSCFIVKGLQGKKMVSYKLNDYLTQVQKTSGSTNGVNVPIKQGDIIRLAVQSNKVVQSLVEFCPRDKGYIYLSPTSIRNGYGQRYNDGTTREVTYGFGAVDKIVGENILLNYGTGYQPALISDTAKVYMYNVNTSRLSVGKASDICVGDKVYYQIIRGTIEAIVIYHEL